MNQQRLVAGVATVLVVGLVVAGLFVAGSPSTARKENADRIRVEHLSSLHFQLQDHRVRTGMLPDNLSQLDFFESDPRFDPRRDPESGELFEYRRTGEETYQICATFQSDSGGSRRDPHSFPDGFDYSHGAGRKCFSRQVDSQVGPAGPKVVEIVRPGP